MMFQVTKLFPNGEQATEKTRYPAYKDYEMEIEQGNLRSFIVSAVSKVK